jgi:Tol biopolymer transport system component/plastocyanin
LSVGAAIVAAALLLASVAVVPVVARGTPAQPAPNRLHVVPDGSNGQALAPNAVVGEGWYRQGLGQAAPEQVSVVTVTMSGTAFQPDVVTTTVGGIVRWTNTGTSYHTTTSEQGYWDSGALVPSQSYMVRFLSPGTYSYYCRYHRTQGMVGTVVVQGGAPPPLPTAGLPTPEGEIVFSDWNVPLQSDIFIAQPDGSGRKALATSDTFEAQPSWAPDRSHVAFTRRATTGTWTIWIADRATGADTQVTTGSEDYEPDWSPDAGRILFTRLTRTGSQPPSRSGIWEMAPDGSGAHALIELESTRYSLGNPAWYPDMSRIALTLADNAGFGSQAGEIYTMNADGSNALPLFHHPGWDDIDPAWSPDGRYVAFASGVWAGSTNVTNHDVWLYDTQTGRYGVAAGHASYDLRGPAWSPSGLRLVFSAEVVTGRWNLYMVDLTTGRVSGPVTSGVEPDWAGMAGVPGTPVPTATPAAGTPTAPPYPTFPPGSPPPPPPFPTIPPPEPTSTGPAPTYSAPTETATTMEPTNTPGTPGTPGPTLPPQSAYRIFLPYAANSAALPGR